MTTGTWDLGTVQNVRRYVVMAGIAVVLAGVVLIKPVYGDESYYHFWTEMPGYLAIVVAIGLRLWCTLYIGGSKSRTLVTDGPYSVSRNPLYFASILVVFALVLADQLSL